MQLVPNGQRDVGHQVCQPHAWQVLRLQLFVAAGGGRLVEPRVGEGLHSGRRPQGGVAPLAGDQRHAAPARHGIEDRPELPPVGKPSLGPLTVAVGMDREAREVAENARLCKAG